ncbi:MAG: TetR/AcrR family transcriptional regulator [Deltaproteobacteria bacterium]|nr:TetR/AcrR family transcriptional regulator [Candidatus Zymogenaceae bacterium]
MKRSHDSSGAIREPVQARSREKKTRIVQSARELINKKGYDAITTSSIAQRAGVSIGTLYAYFSDKKDILMEVVAAFNDDIYNHFQSGISENTADNLSLEETIDAVLHALWHAHIHEKRLHNEIVILSMRDPEVDAAFSANEKRLYETIRELLIRFNDRIEVNNPAAAMFVLKFAVDGVLNRLLDCENKMDVEAVLREMSSMILKYLIKTPKR